MLKDKKVFISGASGAIGFSIAEVLLSNSVASDIFLTGRSEKLLDQSTNNLKTKFPEIRVFSKSADLSNYDQIINVINYVKEKLEHVDILVNCAGIFNVKNLTLESYEDISEIFHINLFAPIIFSKEFSKSMIQNQWGKIINIGSSSCYTGYKNTSLYCSTKHGLLGFSKSLHDELKDKNISVSCISPSSTKSRIGDTTPLQDKDTFLDPQDVAKVVYDILSLSDGACIEELLIKRRIIR